MATAFQATPYGFDRVFAAGLGEAANANVAEADLAARIEALEGELEQVARGRVSELAAARVDGFNAGLSQARGERETAVLAAIDALHAAIESLDVRIDDTTSAIAADAAEVALAAADILAARALAATPCAAIDDAIGRVLRQVAPGQELEVRVHPSLVGEMERLIDLRQSQDRRRLNLSVCGEDGLSVGDARVGWDEGGLALDANARRVSLLAELEGLLPAI